MALQATISCPLRMVAIKMKGRSTLARRLLQRANTARRRMGANPAPEARRRPKKKSAKALKLPGVYVSWPILMPHDLFQNILKADMQKQVSLGPCRLIEPNFSIILSIETDRYPRMGDNMDWTTFWELAKSEPWGLPPGSWFGHAL